MPAVDDQLNARYTPFDGKPAFLEAAANWYRNVHGVELDANRGLFAVEGAVDGLADLFSILLDEGDAVAFADPYYPSYHCMANMRGAHEVLLPRRPSWVGCPDLDAVPASVWDGVRLLVLNYPNNPTGAQAPLAFFEQAVKLAVEHDFVVVHDFAYAGLGVEEQQHSLLEVVAHTPAGRRSGSARWRSARSRRCMRWRDGVPDSSPVANAFLTWRRISTIKWVL